MDLHELTAMQAAESLRRGECSSEELTRASLERIEASDASIGAFLSLRAEEALEEARAADSLRARSQSPSLLSGVPLAVKDNMCLQGLPTTCGSKMLEHFRPPYDATAVSRARKAGLVILGKTNMDEFAMGSSTENSAFRATRNPWDISRVPGGSSGGSAAAVAAAQTPLALGSDTGGSIRQPAAFCGVVGVKPTYGRVSRYGLVAYGSSLDQIGPFARTVEDAAALLGIIAGHDEMDATSWPEAAPDFLDGLDEGVGGMRVGIPREYFIEGIDAEIEAAARGALGRLAELGAEPVEISLPATPYAIPTYYICAMAEASSNLARYDGAHYGMRAEGAENIIEMMSRTRALGFGAEVKRRIMLGSYVLSAGFYDAWYLKALRVRTLFKRDFEAAFERCDVILAPVSPSPPFRIGEKIDDPLTMYLMDIFTVPANLSGNPAISVPCAMSGEGLPIAAQLIAPFYEERRLLRAARALEQASGLGGLRAPDRSRSGG